MHLEEAVQEAFPRRPGLDLFTLAVDQIPVKLTTASVNVHLGGPEPSRALPEISSNPEDSDDEEGEVGLEEVLSRTKAFANGRDSSVKLALLVSH